MLKKMLQDSNNNFWSIALACIGDGVIATDISEDIVFFNTAAEEITGWTKKEVTGKKIYDIFKLKDATTNKKIESPINNVLRLGVQKGLNRNSMLVTKKGEYKYVSANISPIIDDTRFVFGTVMIFKDITEIRNMELKLKSEQNNLINIFNSTPAGVIVLDEDSNITKINEAALYILNSKEDASIGKKFGDAFCCNVRKSNKRECGNSKQCDNCEVKKAITLALLSDISTTNIEFSKAFFLENKIVELWFRASITSMVENGKKSAVIIFMDITDRKKKETEITNSRDYYLGMFENLPLIVWKTNCDGKNEYVNRNYCDFIGKTKQECMDLDWLKYLHPEDKDKYYEVLVNSFKKRQPYEIEYRKLNNIGDYRWIHSINRPLYDLDGKFDGYINIGIDITDRKIAEVEQKRYHILTEKVRDIILFMDIEGNIIDINESAMKSYGYSYEEFLKLNYKDLHAEGAITKEEIKKIYCEGSFFKTLQFRKDGSTFPIEISCRGAEIEGKQVIVSIIRDITERIEAEKSLYEAKEAAEIANKTKSEFLANMSHEIRTPLNGIVGMVDLTLLSELDSEQKENLIIVKSCANQLLKVINDILDFSKMEAGKLVIEKVNFDVKSLIEKIVKAHSPQAVNKGVELNYSFTSTLPQYLIGDPDRLQQILNNLIGNAIKFTDNGDVWIKVKTINMSAESVEIQFSVEDSGIGISEKNIGMIFRSFSQVDESFTKRFGGTGLGLAISKQLSEMMGGKLWVESKQGVGSTFYFILKFEVSTETESLSNQIAKTYKINRPCNVLLTEDDKVNQMVITRILKNRGYTVDTADNGEEAIKMFKNKSYDMVLMDIQMPVMDGIEATKKIRKLEKNKHTPIIAITAYALKGDRGKFLSRGMDEYVSKPVKADELFSAIDKCLSLKKENENLSDISIFFDDSGEVVLKPKEARVFDKKELLLIDELSCLIESLNDALLRNEVAPIEMLAHKIKNLSNEIGIDELKTISFKIELAVRRGDFDEVIKRAKKVSHIFEVFKKYELEEEIL